VGGSDITAGALTDTTNSFVYNPVADTIGTIASIPLATGETRALNFNGQMWVLAVGATYGLLDDAGREIRNRSY
jgi:hypothetical protein